MSLRLGRFPSSGRYWPRVRLLVELRVQRREMLERFPSSVGISPSETVDIEVQRREVGRFSELGRYRPAETVASDIQCSEVGEVSELGPVSTQLRLLLWRFSDL